VYAIKTTGVCCRPSSSTRLPRLENIEFFDIQAVAKAADYRASKDAADHTSSALQYAARCWPTLAAISKALQSRQARK